MNQATHTAAATESTRTGATLESIRMPRRQRIGSAIASVLVSAAVFGSVVLGMTSKGDDNQQLASQSRATTQA